MSRASLLFVAVLSTILSPLSLVAQGTVEDYQRAYAVQRTFNYDKVKHHVDDVRWGQGNQFWYHMDGRWHCGHIGDDGSISPSDSTLTNEEATRLWASQRARYERRGWPGRQRAEHRFTNKRRHERHWMEVDDERDADPVLSPDSSMVAFIRNDNVWVAKPDGSEARPLSTDGTLSHYFSSYIQWSPDGRYVSANRIRPVDKRYVYYVESSPADQLQPILHKQEYAKPGDELMQKTPYIFEVTTGKSVKADGQLIDNQYSLNGPEWRKDSQGIRFEYNQRGHKLYRIYEMNAASGDMRTLIEEKAETYVRYSNYFRQNLQGDSLILWLSERDGWPHLWLWSEHKGKAKHRKTPLNLHGAVKGELTQVTKGEWCVRRVLKVDEEKGLIYFTANGRNANEDPYHIHYYRIGLDGQGLTDLTPEPANHQARFNDDFTGLIDSYSTVETAPVTIVRTFIDDASAQKKGVRSQETILARADISELKAEGWTAPEVFTAPGRDGVTPMWGIIQRPSNFDPTKKYPIIEYIYAGPGDSYTPKSFQPYNWTTTSLAELGFIVVQLDAMGTSNRGKRFEETCYKNLKDAGFPDRIAWIKAAAAKYPYMDIDRVGIYGCSAGGQESTTAVLLHGDFYKAAYSACGCHDNRMDKIWWNEQWMGYPVDSSYVACSNVENAHKLERPLMLLVGELDDNVDPASTMQVANALIRAGKDFELVVIPGAHHTMGESYGEHKRFDFFVRHLLGVTPPAWQALEHSNN